MAKVILKTKEFKLPIYGCKIIFVYSNSIKDIIKFVGSKDIATKDLEGGDFEGYSFHIPEREEYWLLAMKHRDKYEEIDTITHEVAHMASEILLNRGIKFSAKDNNESYAYLTGYINKEFFKFKDGK